MCILLVSEDVNKPNQTKPSTCTSFNSGQWARLAEVAIQWTECTFTIDHELQPTKVEANLPYIIHIITCTVDCPYSTPEGTELKRAL